MSLSHSCYYYGYSLSQHLCSVDSYLLWNSIWPRTHNISIQTQSSVNSLIHPRYLNIGGASQKLEFHYDTLPVIVNVQLTHKNVKNDIFLFR